MTSPQPEYYLITKDELTEVFSFVQHAPEFTQEIEGDVLSRPYSAAQSGDAVLDELERWVEVNRKGCANPDMWIFTTREMLQKIAELRAQQKGEQG